MTTQNKYDEEFKKSLVSLYQNGKTQSQLCRRTYHTLQELHDSVFEYIESFYNSRRPHSSLGLLTPDEKERLYWEQNAAATQNK